MSDDDTPAAEGSEGAEKVTISRAAWDSVREAANRKDTSKEREQRLERENRLLRHGIDPESQRGKVLRDSDQELTDELLADFADFAGDAAAAAPTEPQSEGPELLPGEADQTRERQQLSSGAQPEGAGDREDPYHQMLGVYHEHMEKGATQEAAAGEALGHIMDSGDRRTFVPQAGRFPDDELSDLDQRRP